jgi:hypothetical protein
LDSTSGVDFPSVLAVIFLALPAANSARSRSSFS